VKTGHDNKAEKPQFLSGISYQVLFFTQPTT
jgi:hypothetical protein